MQNRVCIGGVLLASRHSIVGASSVKEGYGVTPVQQVLNMLSELKVKGQDEKHNEQVAFSAFTEFCDVTGAEKKERIEEAAQKIQHLEAEIEKADADVARLGDEIAGLDNDIARWTAEQQKAQSRRDAENADYEVTHADYTESIDAIKRAISVLNSRSEDVPQASLIELRKVQKLPEEARKIVESFLQQGVVSEETAPPEANAYEFQSTSIVSMLEKLLHKFEDELTAVEKEEMTRKGAFDVVGEELHGNIKYGERTRGEKVEAKAGREQDGAEARGALEETTHGKAADEKYLQDMVANCHTKSEEFEQRQKLRQGEIDAISKAIEIISSPEVSGAADKHLPALLETRRKASGVAALVQIGRGETAAQTPAQAQVASYLATRARATGSAFLATIAQRAGEDPFVKVKKMIKDLLVRLMEEANSEADHKGWCDEELATNKASRDELSTTVEGLTSKIDEMTALIATLEEEYAALHEDIAKLDEAVEEATRLRQEEKAKNEAAIKDAKAAHAAVQSAITLLKEFYASAVESTALLQGRQAGQQEPPTTWDAPYQGMQDSKGGVIGMLEVVESDFARLDAETSTSESEAETQYKMFMEDSEIDRTEKDTEMRHKGYTRDSTVRFREEHRKDLEGTQKELTAALGYYEKLKPDCVDTGLSYEARVQAREEEIQSLKEALQMLTQEGE